MRPEKLKCEARRPESGDGVGVLGRGSKPFSPPTKGSAASSPSGVQG